MQIETTSNPILRNLQLGSLNEALEEVAKLEAAKSILVSDQSWDLPHVFDHCSRSIHYMMHGYPELKSPFFRSIIGPLAFHIFNWRGKMSHNRREEIPGSSFEEALTVEQSIQKLRTTIEDFQAFEKALHPHFAYGSLSMQRADKANAMHIADHLCLIEYA